MESVFEKIINKLNERIEYHEKRRKVLIDFGLHEEADKITDRILELNFSKNAVEQAVAEYNNGWIPCEIEMPKEHDSIFARFKGTDRWNNAMFEKTSDVVNVTVSDGKGNSVSTHAHTTDGKWSCDLLGTNKSYHIVAWQPLPAPYQPKGE